MRTLSISLLATVAMAASPVAAAAAELVVLVQPGCVWCARFEAEVAPSYPKTAEGRTAPLRRVDITQAWPDDLRTISRERLTPTFILVDAGVEVARMRGYPGDEFFWPLLGEMLVKLPKAEPAG